MDCKNKDGQSRLALSLLVWQTVEKQRAQITTKFVNKVLHNMAPIKLNEIFSMSNTIDRYNLRWSDSSFSLLVQKNEDLKKVWNSCQNKLEIANFCFYLTVTSVMPA